MQLCGRALQPTRVRQMMLGNFKALQTFAGFLQYPEQPTIERLGQIKPPTLVIIGDDAQDLRSVADTLAAGSPGALKVLIPGASHRPPVENRTNLTRPCWNGLDFTELICRRGDSI